MIRTWGHDVIRELRLELVMLLAEVSSVLEKIKERMLSCLVNCSVYAKIFHIISEYMGGMYYQKYQTDWLRR